MNLADSFFNPEKNPLECTLSIKPQLAPNDSVKSGLKATALRFEREHLIAAQRSDQSPALKLLFS